MITKEQFDEAELLIRMYNRQEYEKLPFEKGTIKIGPYYYPARRDKKTSEIVYSTNPNNMIYKLLTIEEHKNTFEPLNIHYEL